MGFIPSSNSTLYDLVSCEFVFHSKRNWGNDEWVLIFFRNLFGSINVTVLVVSHLLVQYFFLNVKMYSKSIRSQPSLCMT